MEIRLESTDHPKKWEIGRLFSYWFPGHFEGSCKLLSTWGRLPKHVFRGRDETDTPEPSMLHGLHGSMYIPNDLHVFSEPLSYSFITSAMEIVQPPWQQKRHRDLQGHPLKICWRTVSLMKRGWHCGKTRIPVFGPILTEGIHVSQQCQPHSKECRYEHTRMCIYMYTYIYIIRILCVCVCACMPNSS